MPTMYHVCPFNCSVYTNVSHTVVSQPLVIFKQFKHCSGQYIIRWLTTWSVGWLAGENWWLWRMRYSSRKLHACNAATALALSTLSFWCRCWQAGSELRKCVSLSTCSPALALCSSTSQTHATWSCVKPNDVLLGTRVQCGVDVILLSAVADDDDDDDDDVE